MTVLECYNLMKADYKDALNRLNSDTLVEKFLLMFKKDKSMDDLRAAIAAENTEAAFRAVHSLKGVAANLSLTPLYKASSELTEQLRPQNEPADKQLFEQLEQCYENVLDVIMRYESEK